MLREITGKKEENLEFKDSQKVTLDAILKKLAAHYGKEFVEYVYDSKTGETRSFLQFLINGRNSSAYRGLDAELVNGDVLAIIPPVGGG